MSVLSQPTVALIGLGNIGFRHLQGLKAIADHIRLLGVDLNAENVDKSRQEWSRANATFGTGADLEDRGADILILATSSNGRLGLMQRWSQALLPKSIVLEKVTFTRMADFSAARDLANSLGASVWVNCPRRIWPSFGHLRSRISAAKGRIEISLSDPDLGLACNSVHIVDAFQYLIGDDDVHLEEAELDSVFESKRAGYKEAYGRLIVGSSAGHQLTITVRPSERADRQLHVRRGEHEWTLDQARGTLSSGDQTIELGRAPYQSELSGGVVKDLLESGRCSLPSLSASANAHRVLLEPLQAALEREGIDCRDGLPIT